MTAFIRLRAALTTVVYYHCGRAMEWDYLRSTYVCHCGATR